MDLIPKPDQVASAASNVAHKVLYGGLADLRPMPRTLIDDGPLRGAALDVFPEEPLPYASPLRTHPKLTLTPHLAGATEEVSGRQYTIAAGGLDGIYAQADGWEQLPVRNPGVRERWLQRRAARP